MSSRNQLAHREFGKFNFLNMKIQTPFKSRLRGSAIFVLLCFLPHISIGHAERDRCYNTTALFDDLVIAELVSVTFEDVSKIKKCKALVQKTNQTDEELPPDVIKVPPRISGKPLEVFLNFFLEDISHIDEEHMQFRIDYYMIQEWIAQRKYCNHYRKLLKTLDIDLMMYNDSGDMLQMNSDFLKIFWAPDSFIVNAKLVTTQSSHPSTKSLLMWVSENTYENGGDDTGGKICNLKLLGRFTAIIPCAMDFRFYPVDVQNCQFHLRSFSFPVDEMILKWSVPPLLRKLHLPQHSSHLSSSNATYVNILQSRQYADQNYSLDDIPDENRVTVGVTALLAFITQFIETRRFIPPISYISWMDIWMLMCMVFVFIQLVEGTIVHYYYSKGKHLIRLRRKSIKRSLKVFEQETDQQQQSGNKLAKLVSATNATSKSVGKWRKIRDLLTYEPPPAELLINRFKYANHVQRLEKFSKQSTTARNQVQFDSSVTYLPDTIDGKAPMSGDIQLGEPQTKSSQLSQLNPTEISSINYSLSSPVQSPKTGLDRKSPFAYNQSLANHSSTFRNTDWTSNIDFRSALSGAEMRNLDLLQLLNDQSVRDWLTETIYPDHVNFGLISLIKHYWKLLIAVDLPHTSAHYLPLKIDKYARVFVPLLYLLCLGVYVLVILTYMEIDNTATLENIFAYKEKLTKKPVL